MTNPASKTIFWFSFYPLGAGLTMILAPTLPLTLFDFPNEGIDWIRMLGVVTAIVGYYYLNNGRTGGIQYARFTVHARVLIPLVFALMVMAYNMPAIYIALTAVDFAGGLWTWLALRSMNIPVWQPWNTANDG